METYTQQEVDCLIASSIKMCADKCKELGHDEFNMPRADAFYLAMEEIEKLTPADAQKALDKLLHKCLWRMHELMLSDNGMPTDDQVQAIIERCHHEKH